MAAPAFKGLIRRENWDVLRTLPPFRLARAVRDRVRRLQVTRDVRRLWGEPGVTLRSDEAAVVCIVRDAEYYLGSFLEHYTRLGAQQIILLDNGSTDRTLEIARRYEQVSVLQTRLPFGTYMLPMRYYLLTHYGKGGWLLHVDSDELIDYPCSASVPLRQLLRYLNQRGYNAMASHMLDMFDELLPSSHCGVIDHDLRARYPYYDLSNLTQIDYAQHYPANRVGHPGVKVLRGGIRQTLFGAQNWLTKHSLVRLDGKVTLEGNVAHDVFKASVADVTAALYHYKFTERLIDQTVRAVREENYYLRSHEYKLYHAVLSANQSLRLLQPTSRRLVDADDLVAQGFLVASPAYLAFAQTCEAAPVA